MLGFGKKVAPQNGQDRAVIEIRISFDLQRNELKAEYKCPGVMLLGILEQVKAGVVRQQIMAELEHLAKSEEPGRVLSPHTGAPMPPAGKA